MYDASALPARDRGPISRDRLAELLADRPVWVAAARRGIEYHHPEAADAATTCGRTTRYGEILRHGDVVARFGGKPCRRCYPDGDETVPLVGGQHPVVLVSKPQTEPALAEVRKARPDGRLVQVVFLQSRTAAWIAATRIVHSEAAGRGNRDLGTPGDGR